MVQNFGDDNQRLGKLVIRLVWDQKTVSSSLTSLTLKEYAAVEK